MWQASRAQAGLAFLLYLLLPGLAVIFAPALVYRIIALQRASYVLEREGIRLFWGLRREEIPMNMVHWVGTADQYGQPLPKPLLRWSGAVLGQRSLPDGRVVEFMAARANHLVLIITGERVFAISPENEVEFMQAYRRLAEYGSLAPIPARSYYPTILLSRFWADRLARSLLMAGITLCVGLFVWVSLAIPTHIQVSLRLAVDGTPLEFVPGVRLLLLPVVNLFFFITDLLLGLFCYRRTETQPLAYLMWSASVLTSILFWGATAFILRAS